MNTHSQSMAGHAVCERPLETHQFASSVDGDDYNCATCGRPRAMHQHDGFTPAPSRKMTREEEFTRFRGPHPGFTRPGSFRDVGVMHSQKDLERLANRRMEEQARSDAIIARVLRKYSVDKSGSTV